jgi:hypothetical protein
LLPQKVHPLKKKVSKIVFIDPKKNVTELDKILLAFGKMFTCTSFMFFKIIIHNSFVNTSAYVSRRCTC